MSTHHRPGDRLVAFGKLRLNMSLAERRREAGDLPVSSLLLGVRQFLQQAGVSLDDLLDRRPSRRFAWDAVDALRGQPVRRCLALLDAAGVRVLGGIEPIVLAFLEGQREVEIDVIETASLRSLVLIPKTEEAIRDARSNPAVLNSLGVDDEEDPEDKRTSRFRRKAAVEVIRSGSVEFITADTAEI